MIIKQELYLNKLINSRYNGFIKIITGIRKCGKSYLFSVLFSSWLKDNEVNEKSFSWIVTKKILIKRFLIFFYLV